jgi:hypothetical protein
MSVTYSAIEVTRPGEFSEVRRPVQDPGPGQVRIRVEACGVCHSDAATVDGLFPIAYPRVPGHEAVTVLMPVLRCEADSLCWEASYSKSGPQKTWLVPTMPVDPSASERPASFSTSMLVIFSGR